MLSSPLFPFTFLLLPFRVLLALATNRSFPHNCPDNQLRNADFGLRIESSDLKSQISDLKSQIKEFNSSLKSAIRNQHSAIDRFRNSKGILNA